MVWAMVRPQAEAATGEPKAHNAFALESFASEDPKCPFCVADSNQRQGHPAARFFGKGFNLKHPALGK